MDGPTQRRLVEEFLAESRSGNGGGNGKGKAAEARN
jgi:hypothetical protein